MHVSTYVSMCQARVLQGLCALDETGERDRLMKFCHLAVGWTFSQPIPLIPTDASDTQTAKDCKVLHHQAEGGNSDERCVCSCANQSGRQAGTTRSLDFQAVTDSTLLNTASYIFVCGIRSTRAGACNAAMTPRSLPQKANHMLL